MGRQQNRADEQVVGTEGGVFGCAGKTLTILVGRTGTAEFVCRTPAAAGRAAADLQAALASDHEAAARLRGAFTTEHMTAFLRAFFPWAHVAYHLRPALVSLDEVRGVLEMGATGERPVEPWEIAEPEAGLDWKAPEELPLAGILRAAGHPERDWPPVPKQKPTARGLAAVSRFNPRSVGGAGGMLVSRARLVELDPARWPF